MGIGARYAQSSAWSFASYTNSAQSAFIPAVKSILVSNDIDEKKRREARRKSLGTICKTSGMKAVR